MRISQLIEQLCKVKDEAGDLPVMVFDGNGDHVDIGGISIGMDEDDDPIEVTICDKETLEALS